MAGKNKGWYAEVSKSYKGGNDQEPKGKTTYRVGQGKMPDSKEMRKGAMDRLLKKM